VLKEIDAEAVHLPAGSSTVKPAGLKQQANRRKAARVLSRVAFETNCRSAPVPRSC
jgi:hypothetical protein